jgi:uncharacterized protein (DUF2141 family)
MNLCRMFLRTKWAIICSVVLYSSSLIANTGNVEIFVGNIRNENGSILISVYDSEEGFPSAPKESLPKAKVPISKGRATHTFKGLPFGEYAVAILHDENKNKKMDYSFFGLPSEGYAFSNNATGFMGPPSFLDAKFKFSTENMKVSIKLNY